METIPAWLADLGLVGLILLANALPPLARYWLGARWSWPIDAHRVLADGQPLFGPTKTWRGGLITLLITPVVALAVVGSWRLGLGVAAAAIAGDLLSSFLKRRLALAPSARAIGLDEIPEALLPALVGKAELGLHWIDVLLIVVAFTLIHWILDRWLARALEPD